MTRSFLPRPSPDHDAFECDSPGHLRGQDVRLLISYGDQQAYGREGRGYISRQGARKKKKGEDARAQESLYQIKTDHTHARQTQVQSPLHL